MVAGPFGGSGGLRANEPAHVALGAGDRRPHRPGDRWSGRHVRRGRRPRL